ncbi:hypothetical protein KDU71_16510 [Carboxylicivirga sediminis]|uniref:ATP-grasp domain-containing protein n=1 Tax=Carboxylicivirga sediminis TaxID=2006564 RepID=A0A941F663_9BACT|nr:hypothetical protein [Carboxylicivirga sediminis]MBR8537174.1 hypothetical protein [Carboxylicivirga sediminis]
MATLFIYNPTCDMAVENGTFSYMPPQQLAKFEADISPIMAFLGQANDFVLYESERPLSFEQFWEKLKVNLPQFINKEHLQNIVVNRIFPWGWSQLIGHRYIKLCQSESLRINASPDTFKNFFSRQTSVNLINELSSHSLPHFIELPTLPSVVSDIKDIYQQFNHSSQGIVLKTLWSSSGRGLLFIRNQQQLENSTKWAEAQIKKHGSLILEPIYTKIQDASLQFNVLTNGSIEFIDINFFDADSSGHFEKEYFHVPDTIKKHLPIDNSWLKDTADKIILSLQALHIPDFYQGPIGIDAMFIINDDNAVRFYPLVEANLRCNMGLVNLSIKRLIHPDASGSWQISQFKPGEADEFYHRQLQAHPIEISNGKITKGFFPLTPFHSNSRFAAWGIADN